ncbi:hypothetical protein XNC1_0897 [Xenorhabdus nematophila ATCC 19061]|uniref:Uncharacterized protein n=1 Tax=Xenorhabdus nematophila (strain ATCC 19061 / DSM 3370 / CCUG 14189 / LMG 1036 / NCIMB 9965 / AN6) TaxID=406817 RepID=D3VL09_XENNA|nr:hypothetical protein XNC1_0897 [Xenorhabdus nematophila ATCC 19061]
MTGLSLTACVLFFTLLLRINKLRQKVATRLKMVHLDSD